MNSIWKDLLFLHGHLLHQQDLEWRADAAPGQDVTNAAVPVPQPVPATHPGDCCAAACA